jgi:glutamine synthetase
MERQQDYVLRSVEERGIRFIRLWFTDVQGFLKSFSITPAELQVALEEGLTFDGSVIEGFSRVQEADMIARPDPITFELLPWRSRKRRTDEADEPYGAHPVARMFCDIQLPDGTPFEGDPRNVLKRNLAKARAAGFTFFAGPEMEFFYFRSPDAPDPVDKVGYFDQTAPEATADLRRNTILTLEAMGIPVEYSHHEIAPGQQEIDLRHADALTMADQIMTFRSVVKEVAHDHGVYATFMPKPITGVNGSGMHTHLSLFEGDVNAFADRSDPVGLSTVAKGFIAGLLHHAPAITAITNPWVNSYKRLVAGYEAPVLVCWARNNRSALVRVPAAKAGKVASARIEYRAPDPACNPYLALAVILAAGLDGIERGMELPPEAAENIYELSSEDRASMGIAPLPQTLAEAIRAMEGSDLAEQALGAHTFEHVLRNKRKEWEDYRIQVSAFERDLMLPVI